ncbi:MAG: L-lactate dehydrogenase [Propionibacteriaceae bacterium]|jgi:L-lactate dehydrogenase|nr:L-lactate dehydrogenase [Propionibacteriaceae bacterium]
MARTSIKISVVGAGFVGATIAYTLMMKGVASNLTLVDVDQRRAEGEAMDIAHGAPFAKVASIHAGSYADTAGSDLVIIAAGTGQRPGESRLDLIARNASIMRSAAGETARHSPEAILLVVANPVDVMSYVAQRASGFPAGRVIGSGTVLDSSRFRYLLARRFGGLDPRNIHGYILGEHGDSEFPAWSLVNVAGMAVGEAAETFGVPFDESAREAVAREVREAAYDIIERKKATYYGIGMAASRITEALVRDEHAIMSVSVLLQGQYGLDDVYLSLPAVLGQRGVARILSPRLDEAEVGLLRRSAELLQTAQAGLAAA